MKCFLFDIQVLITLTSLTLLFIVSVKGSFNSIKKLDKSTYFLVEQTDWLRGIAIIMVVLSHYYPRLGTTYSNGLISFSMNIGALGVAIFLLLSGYAIANVL